MWLYAGYIYLRGSPSSSVLESLRRFGWGQLRAKDGHQRGFKPLPGRCKDTRFVDGILLRLHRSTLPAMKIPEAFWMPTRTPSLAARPIMLRYQKENSGGSVLFVHALSRPVAIDARHAAALPACPPPGRSVARCWIRHYGPTTVYFGPAQPGSSAQLYRPCQKAFTILRLYSPPGTALRQERRSAAADQRDRTASVIRRRRFPPRASAFAFASAGSVLERHMGFADICLTFNGFPAFSSRGT